MGTEISSVSAYLLITVLYYADLLKEIVSKVYATVYRHRLVRKLIAWNSFKYHNTLYKNNDPLFKKWKHSKD